MTNLRYLGLRTIAALTSGLCIWAMVVCHSAKATDRRIKLFIPSLVAPDGSKLGLNAATAVNVAIWRTLRKAPSPNPKNADFGSATLVWSEDPLDGASALMQAESLGAIGALWGNAFAYGIGAVVSLHLDLLLPNSAERRLQDWIIELPMPNGKTLVVETDALPERTFLFRPVALKGETLKAYLSPALLDIYKTAGGSEVIGRTRGGFHAFEQSTTTALIASEEGVRGFLKLPPEAYAESSATNFTGAIIRVLRKDWSGAISLLQLVAMDPATPSSIQIDSLLLEAFCLERTGQSGQSAVAKALEINPFATRAHKFQVMVQLSDISRSLRQGHPLASISSALPPVVAELAKAASGLDATDSWLLAARLVLYNLTAR